MLLQWVLTRPHSLPLSRAPPCRPGPKKPLIMNYSMHAILPTISNYLPIGLRAGGLNPPAASVRGLGGRISTTLSRILEKEVALWGWVNRAPWTKIMVRKLNACLCAFASDFRQPAMDIASLLPNLARETVDFR